MSADLITELRRRLHLERIDAEAAAAAAPTWAPNAGHNFIENHIVRYSPAFVLADIAAKRKLIDMHAEFDFPHDTDDGPGDYAWTAQCDGCHEPVPCTTVRLLAEAYGIRADG